MFKKILPLNIIISLRMFGLFIVLPVLSVYALDMPNSNHTMVGIIIGGYAITQMLFQVPFGMVSDKIGRKKTIIVGLIIFAIGSLVAGLADNIYTLLIGRLLQGAGAIGSVITATISDVVREEERGKAMAIMGGSIGMAFALSMVAGPFIASYFGGVPTLFFLVTFLALLSIFVLIKYVPNPPIIKHTYLEDDKFKLFENKNLTKMNITNLLVKGFMTFAFMIIPIVLTKTYGWQESELYKIYLPSMIVGILAMGPATMIAEQKGKYKLILLLGVLFLSVAYLIIGLSHTYMMFATGIIIFFIGFNLQEPILQSLASKYAKVHQRGRVLGIFNSFGYFGTFIGGFIGGVLLDIVSLNSIEYGIIVLCIAWAIMLFTLDNPAKTKIAYIHIDDTDTTKHQDLYELKGCKEWYINDTEKLVIVKYDEDEISEEEIRKAITHYKS
ncbi:MAG TPA: MFS transporter [Campylobacterales bacterium]|nr:MFS transporter [Campylobacterales bacterium]